MTSTLKFTPLTYEEWLGTARRHQGPGPHKTGSPQSIHGKGGGTAMTIAKQGGDSVQPLTGRRPSSGYMVARPPRYGTIVSAADWFANGEDILTQFVDQRISDYEADPDLFVGVWWDKKHAEFALDESRNVQDRDTALTLGAQWDQQSIWDVVRFEEIPTGGTGGRSGQDRHPAAGRLALDDRGGEAGLGSRADRGDAGGLRGRARDPEVAEALRAFYARHLPGQHDQKSHAGGRGRAKAALDAAEAAGQRTMKPITSAAQLDKRQRASLDEAWDPWTRTRKDTGEKVTLQVDRAEIKREIADTIRNASPEDRAAGMRWYQEGHDWGMAIAAKYDMDPETVFKVTSALSPKTGWEANKTKAEKIIAAYKRGDLDGLDDIAAAKRSGVGFASHINSNATQAVRILRGEQGLPTGLKRQSFVNNLHHPENGFDITVDGWVAGALQRSSHGLSEDDALAWVNRGTNQARTTGLVVEGKGYIAVADVMREVAAEMGMSPQQAQAVYWVAAGGGSGAAMWENES